MEMKHFCVHYFVKKCLYSVNIKMTECGAIYSMDDPQAVPPGTKGTVKFVDDIGSIHCHWDNGRSLEVIPGEDSFHMIPARSRDDGAR